MPLITVTYASPYQRIPAKSAIAAEIARLSNTILKKDLRVTAVIVQQADPADWFCGGRSLADAGLASFWLDIHVVDGTNTKGEKADFIAAAYGSMRKLLGALHEESYVHVHDVRGDAYGYGGVTQDQRYFQGNRPVASAA